jgi:hypothetical protein
MKLPLFVEVAEVKAGAGPPAFYTESLPQEPRGRNDGYLEAG